MRKPWLVVVVAVIPFVVQAQDQCINTLPAQYVLTADRGSPNPEPGTRGFGYTLKNDSNVLIRLEGINPYAFKCSASTSTSDFKETAVPSFLGLIGGVAGGIGGSAGGPSATGATGGLSAALISKITDNVVKKGELKVNDTPTDCQRGYLNSAVHAEVQRLDNLRLAINQTFQTTQKNQAKMLAEFNDRVRGLVELRTGVRCTDIVSRAQNLIARDVFAIEDVASEPVRWPLDEAIDQVAFQVQLLIGHLNDGLSGACEPQDARPYIDEDAAFLSALIVSTTTAPSAVEKWRNQLKALNTVRNNIVNAQNSIAAILSNRQNFTIDTSIHGNQQIVTYTAACTPLTLQSIVAPDPAAITSTTPTASSAPPTTGASTTPPSGSTWKHDFKFGPGPRFVYAGGIVISPLQQVAFSTTATPGGSGATANTIIQQQKSSTRILPIAMLHARYWDQLPPQKAYAWIPNYLSAGVTAKSSDTKGTNIEYLFGPSWSFADRQFFITAGAYAGQQQRLANSLMVGSTTSLSSANLPITQSTIWKVGFAITWAPAGK